MLTPDGQNILLLFTYKKILKTDRNETILKEVMTKGTEAITKGGVRAYIYNLITLQEVTKGLINKMKTKKTKIGCVFCGNRFIYFASSTDNRKISLAFTKKK